MKTQSCHPPVRTLRSPFVRLLLVAVGLFTASHAFAQPLNPTPRYGATVPLTNIPFQFTLPYETWYASPVYQIVIRTNPAGARYDIYKGNIGSISSPDGFTWVVSATLNPAGQNSTSDPSGWFVPLLPSTTYWWETVTYWFGTDPNDENAPPPDTFATESGFIPFTTAAAAAPQLIKPRNGYSAPISKGVNYEWTVVPGAVAYQFQLSSAANFPSPLTQNIRLPAGQYPYFFYNGPSAGLKVGTVYSWRVWAYYYNGSSGPVAYGNFVASP